jgi:hypothetical protein
MTIAIWPPGGAYIPDGQTWTGDTGREWEATGGDLYLPYPPSPRNVLADALTAAIGTDTGVQVYASPPEVPVPPAVVIMPADPYQAPNHAAGTNQSAWAFDIDIILRRNKSEPALDALERAREVIAGALPAGWRWVEFGEIGEIEIAKKTYLKGTLGVAVSVTEGLAQYG